jgi:hypothetical protein
MTSGYSKFFTFKELTNSNSFPELVKQNRIDAMKFVNSGKRLSKLLESIRGIWNKAINVTSGFRNTTLNIKVGSLAKNSAHQRFEASDLLPPEGMTLEEFFDGIFQAHKDGLLPDLRKAIREDHRGICHVEVKMNAKEVTNFYTTNNNINFKEVK